MIDINRVAEVEISYSTRIKPSERQKVTSSQDSYDILLPFFEKYLEHREAFFMILLNRNNQVLGVKRVSEGSIGSCLVDMRLIYQAAIKSNSSSIIVAHNHPSGNLKPSQDDISLTNKIKNAGQVLDILLLDHIILGEKGHYYSFEKEGRL